MGNIKVNILCIIYYTQKDIEIILKSNTLDKTQIF